MCRCSVSREEPPPPAPARERTGGAAPVSEPKARSRGRRLDPLGHTATSRVGWRLPDSVLVPGHRTARSSGRPVDARWRLPDSEPITFVWRGLKRHLTEGNASRSGNRHPTARTDCPTGPPAHRPTTSSASCETPPPAPIEAALPCGHFPHPGARWQQCADFLTKSAQICHLAPRPGASRSCNPLLFSSGASSCRA